MKMTTIQYNKKILAFLDILGFERIVNESRSNPELIERIARILTRSRDVALLNSKISPKVLCVNPGQYMHRAFSDTSIISGPYMSHDDMNFLSWWVMSYQYLMWKEERTFIRGAIVYGDIYEDADVVFGPALLDAYNLERSKGKADWPRVLIDKSLLDKASEAERRRDLLEFVRQDEDSLVYLDYLRELFHLFVLAENKRIIGEREKDFGLPISLFKDHKEAILAQCRDSMKEEYRDNSKEVFRKYVDLSNYHNSTIDRFRQVKRDIANSNGLVCQFFEDQMKSDKAKETGAIYKPKYSAEEYPEQSEMLDILTAAINRIIENPPPDIMRTQGIVIIGRTNDVELSRVIRTLSREAPRELSSFDKALEESKIDINSLDSCSSIIL